MLTGIDLHFYPFGDKNYGCHRFLNRWPPVSTGHRHLDGFDPVIQHTKKQVTLLG